MSLGNLVNEMDAFFGNQQENQARQSGVINYNPTAPTSNGVLDIFYKKLEDMGMNLDELKPILECEDNLLIMSGAGAGKTTALVLKIIRDMLAGVLLTVQPVNTVNGVSYVTVPAKILVSTFLKTGALELQAALREWCEKLDVRGVDYSSIQFKTIHAEVKDALTKMGAQVRILEDVKPMIKAVAQKYNIRSITALTRTIGAEEVGELLTIMNYARNRFDAKKYEHPLANDYGLNTILMDAFLADFKIYRQSTGQMDFEDMQEMLLEYAKLNPNVLKFIEDRYDYLFIDEFQDTSQLQYEILKLYFKGAKRTIAVGDSDQCIYSFRGSDNSIIRVLFIQDMKPTVLSITTNYRCRTNILEFVKQSIILNGSDHSKELKSAKDGGEVAVHYDADVNHMVQSIKEDLVRGLSVGVQARTNSDLLIPALILELDGNINFGLSKSVSLSGRMPRQILSMLDLVTKRVTRDFEQLLKTFVKRNEWFEVERLVAVLDMNPGLSLYTIEENDLKYSAPSLYKNFLHGLRTAYADSPMAAYLFILGVLETHIFISKSSYSKKAKDLTIFIRRLITEHTRLKTLSLNEIDVLFRSTLPERLTNRIRYATDVKVKLTTVHEAKGKEWDSVYIWNNTDGSFPNQVGNREITQDELEEERRVHYIALTRAKQKLTIYTAMGRVGKFLQECNYDFANRVNSEVDPDVTKLFKRKDKSFEDLDSKQRARDSVNTYIRKTRESGSIAHDDVANMEIVLNVTSLDELVRICHDEYGVGKSNDSEQDLNLVFENVFKMLADKVFTEGDFSAD